MVQIVMSSSGQGSKNRADRASLDDPAAFPLPTNIPQLAFENKSFQETTPESSGKTDLQAEKSPEINENEEEEEDYEFPRIPPRKYSKDDSNNNDLGLVLDPWACTTSLIPPPIFEDSNSPSPSQTQTKTKKSKTSKSSFSSNRKTRRSSSSSGLSSTSAKSGQKRMATEVINTQTIPKKVKDSTKPDEIVAEPIPYCYRCFETFPSQMKWRDHALYEHILKKNPYPIVEMNYIHPKDIAQWNKAENSSKEDSSSDDNVFQNSPDLANNNNENVLPKEQLKFRFCKEKGTYMIKASSSDDPPLTPVVEDKDIKDKEMESSQSSKQEEIITNEIKEKSTIPTAILSVLKEKETNSADSKELEAKPNEIEIPMELEDKKEEMIKDPVKVSAANILKMYGNITISIDSKIVDEEENKKEDVQKQILSIESELATDFNIDDEFERALEMATERSRVGEFALFKRRDSTENDDEDTKIPSAGGIVAVPEEGGVGGVAKMISEDVLPTQVATAPKPKEPSSSVESHSNHEDKEESKKETPRVSTPPTSANTNSDEETEDETTNSRKTPTPPVAGGENDSDDSDPTTLRIDDDERENEPVPSTSNGEKEKDPKDPKDPKDRNGSEETTANPEEKETEKRTAAVESDDLACRMCQKVFPTDEELHAHFSEEHFRLAGNSGILEPESPCPSTARSIFAEEEEEFQPLNPLTLTSAVANSSGKTSDHLNSLNSFIHARRLSTEQPQGLEKLLMRNSMVSTNTQNSYRHQQIGGQQIRYPNPPSAALGGPNNRPSYPPNMMVTGMSGQLRSQMIGPRQNLPPNHPLLSSSRPQYYNSQPQNPSQQQQRPGMMPSQHRPSSYPVSLHSALTTQSPSILRSSQMNDPRMQQQLPPRPQLRTMPPPQPHNNGMQNQIRHSVVMQQQQQQQQRGPISQTQQQFLSQINNQQRDREMMIARSAAQAPPMPRLQQNPQLRLAQPQQQQQQPHQRPNNISQAPGQQQIYKRTASSEIEIHEIRPNKQPRLDNRLPQATSNQNQGVLSMPSLDRNIVSALGAAGNGGVPSVRLGNSITLSVCPTSTSNSTSIQHVSPAHSPATITESRLSGSRSSSPIVPQSVLAVRGVTVTSASPPIRDISPASNPSPSGSPHLQQHGQSQYSVIQRGPSSSSPVGQQQMIDGRKFSPPVITTVRGPPGISPVGNPYPNFAVPRAPGPRTQMMQQQPGQQSAGGFAMNPSAERPDRPPTVDLTDDDVQSHNMQRLNNQSHQRQFALDQQNQQRRFVQMQPPQQTRGGVATRLICTICNIAFPSIIALDTHKLERHGMRSGTTQNVTGNVSARPPPTAIRSGGVQMRDVRLGNPNMSNTVQHNAPVRAPPPPQPQQIRGGMISPQIRSTNSPINRSNLPPSNNTKYLYIPLIDLSRMDNNKLRKLEEIGISCVVPLQDGTNTTSVMGIPVMTLRSDVQITNQHVPWDSVLPMGPVDLPRSGALGSGGFIPRGGNTGNNNPNSGGNR